jgi:hypothetical protein
MWPGSLVVAIFGDPSDYTLPSVCSRSNVRAIPILPTPEQAANPSLFPINTLRNTAMNAVTTSHLLYLDVDFYLSRDLHAILHDPSITTQLMDPGNVKLALVIPAFEYLANECNGDHACDRELKKTYVMPETMRELVQEYERKKVTVFERMVAQAHGSTDLKATLQQPPKSIRPIPCITSNRYEPYVVVRKCGIEGRNVLPGYQQAFTGYGKNKISHILHIRDEGYSFAVLGGGFVVHYPHVKSSARMNWQELSGREKKKLVGLNKEKDAQTKEAQQRQEEELKAHHFADYHRVKMDTLFVDFKQWLQGRDHEGLDEGTRMCEGASDDDNLANLPV